MEANTLRIGNWVYDDFKEVHRVELLSSDQYKSWIQEPNIILSKISRLKGFYQSDEVFPIPIDEDWLLKIGFTWKKTAERYMLGSWSLLSLTKDLTVEFSGNYLIYIKYIHQIQNLYFVLCGEELIIKD